VNVLLMCQGQQRRLPHLAIPKHLLEVNGEPILRRTLRLLNEIALPPRPLAAGEGYPQVHVFGRPELANVAPVRPDWPIRFGQLANPGFCIVDGIRAALEDLRRLGWWANEKRRSVVLLGDVVWSRASLSALLLDPRPVVFAGTPVLSQSQGEVFAAVFEDTHSLEKLCRTAPCQNFLYAHQQGGHLRRLLWHAQHEFLPPSTRSVRRPPSRSWCPEMYLPIDDWTKDVDTDQDVKRLPTLAQLAELEDRGRRPAIS